MAKPRSFPQTKKNEHTSKNEKSPKLFILTYIQAKIHSKQRKNGFKVWLMSNILSRFLLMGSIEVGSIGVGSIKVGSIKVKKLLV